MKSRTKTPPEESEIVEMNPERFADLLIFSLAYDAFAGEMNLAGGKVSKDPLWLKGYVIAVRFSSELHQGIVKYALPLASRPEGAPLRAALAQGMRGTNINLVKNQAELLGRLLLWFRSNGEAMRSIFEGRSAKSIQSAILAVTEDSAAARLNKLSLIPSLSGLRMMTQWSTQASERLGIPLSTVEETVRDAEIAANLGEDLQNVRGKIQGAVPNSPESANLIAEEQATLGKIEKVVQTSKSPTAVLAAASVAATQRRSSHRTQTGKRLGLTPEQEDAMEARGRVVIAAGAGSGKTRVLAAKVAYHINELGTPARSILATSFTRKAAAELKQRIRSYGGMIDGGAENGFGTTHSIAFSLLSRYKNEGVGRPSYVDPRKDSWKTTTILRLAMNQVEMGATFKEPFVVESLWERSFDNYPTQTGTPVAPPSLPPQGNLPEDEENLRDARLEAFQKAVKEALVYWTDQSTKVEGTGRDIANWRKNFLSDMLARDPSKLTDKQKQALNNALSQTRGRTPIRFRVGGYNPDALVTTGGRVLFAETSEDAGTSEDNETFEAKESPLLKTRLSEYTTFEIPANQWFNLGEELVRKEFTPQGGESETKEKISIGEFRKYITKYKGAGLSPTEMMALAGDKKPEIDPDADPQLRAVQLASAKEAARVDRIFAAVYGAYEWIKGPTGEPKFQGLGDTDDSLIDVVRGMIAKPDFRRAMNDRFKVVLVDEAQDLNPVQHLMFGLIAGYLDPKTLKPNPGKKMTADTLAFIGDDKQAIYEFRGAAPNLFIGMSNLTPGGDDFDTKKLDTNFRSGSAIVAAAGNLISKNLNQIPIACKATPNKGTGEVKVVDFKSEGEGAAFVAMEISDFVNSGHVNPYSKEEGRGGYASFGIAVRSNQEAYAYGIQMLRRGIPFKSNVNFFNDKAAKALLGWLTLNEKGSKGEESRSTSDDLNEAIIDATAYPRSMLGEAFKTKLRGFGKDYIETLLAPGAAVKIQGKGKWADYLEVFIENLKTVMEITGEPSEIVKQILSLQGVDGKSFEDSLIESFSSDAEKMEELAAVSEGPKGKLTVGQVKKEALAVVEPLKDLIGTLDDLGEAMSYIRKLRKINSKISSRDGEDEIDRNAVTISTMHGWKGLEVPHMYIPMIGGRFPRVKKGRSESDEDSQLESDRRLAYVAITRAEDRATILDIPNKLGMSSQFIKEACLRPENEKQASSDKWADGPMIDALLLGDYRELKRISSLLSGWGEVLS